MRKFIIGMVVSALVGCASSSGVLPEGADSFMVSREGGTGFAGVAGLKKDAYREANAFCESKGKKIEVTTTNDHPGGVGVYPLAEVHFMCLDAGDPGLTRVRMTPQPNSVVEIRNR